MDAKVKPPTLNKRILLKKVYEIRESLPGRWNEEELVKKVKAAFTPTAADFMALYDCAVRASVATSISVTARLV